MKAKKMFLKAVVPVVFSLCIVFTSALADENSQHDSGSQFTNGQVESTDWVASEIAVNTGEEVLSFKLDEHAVIKRGNDSISLSDIEISDQLGIEYKTNPDGRLIATRITDQNLGND